MSSISLGSVEDGHGGPSTMTHSARQHPRMVDNAVLRFDRILKRFGSSQALDKASLPVKRGAIHGLIGQNGAGKSTLIKLLAGVHRLDAGCIEIDGTGHDPVDTRTRARRSASTSSIIRTSFSFRASRSGKRCFWGRRTGSAVHRSSTATGWRRAGMYYCQKRSWSAPSPRPKS
jgi:ABC-type phosphonate transport system ATPase subunit